MPQARQTFAQRKTWKPASHQTKLKKKVFGTRMRKGRTPAGFVPKPLRNRSRKNAETSLKPPGQTQEKGVWDAQQVLCPSHCETVAGKMPKRRCWNPLERRKYISKPCETAARNSAQTMRNRSQKTAETLLLEPTKNKEKSRLKQGKPLRDVRLGSLQATGPNSRKRCLGRACEKAEPQQVLCPSHCETVARKMPKRRCWNPLKRERNRAQTMRNRSQKLPKRCFWTLLKTKKKPASHQAKLKKKVFGTRMRKGRTPAGFVPKPLRNRSRKNAERSLLEPIRKIYICPNHAKPQPENCRNVAFGTY